MNKYKKIFKISLFISLLLFAFFVIYNGLQNSSGNKAKFEVISLTGKVDVFIDDKYIGQSDAFTNISLIKEIEAGRHDVKIKRVSDSQYPEIIKNLKFDESRTTSIGVEIAQSMSMTQLWTIEPQNSNSLSVKINHNDINLQLKKIDNSIIVEKKTNKNDSIEIPLDLERSSFILSLFGNNIIHMSIPINTENNTQFGYIINIDLGETPLDVTPI